jgi:predicted adenine nucleotide alpha hydrolase (AANH) superfamily ATPase
MTMHFLASTKKNGDLSLINAAAKAEPMTPDNLPPLVLHICCAPDEAWVVHTLANSYRLHCFFSNPNIQPAQEYHKRLQEAQRVAAHYQVPFDAALYRPELWERATEQHQHTPEGGSRCAACFDIRLEETAQFCVERGYPSFTTVMSISPHKRIQMLNTAGAAAAQRHGINYLGFDFKKKNGFLQSIALSNQLGLYRQDYCGCRLSRTERDQRAAQRATQPINNL